MIIQNVVVGLIPFVLSLIPCSLLQGSSLIKTASNIQAKKTGSSPD